MQRHDDSTCIGHRQCPSCAKDGADRAQDNLAVYDDGHGYCFKCGYHTMEAGKPMNSTAVKAKNVPEKTGAYEAISDRRLSAPTCKKFDITQANGKQYYHYYNQEGEHVGTKVRNVSDKKFFAMGNLQEATLFGQQQCRGGGKYITITEGELDAAAVSEMFENRYDVVSLKTGASGAVKDIKANLEFLESYDNIVLCFDNDTAGKNAVKAVLNLFSPNKVKVMSLPLKDASDMLMANRVRDFTKAFWDAKSHKPTGVKSFSDESMWEAFMTRGSESVTPFPESYGSLNYMMNGGIAQGEITVIGALTSVGKSTMVYNLVYDMMMNTNKKVGVILLEADMGEITEKLVSLHVGQNVSNIPYEDRDMVELRKAYDDVALHNKLEIYEHHGASDTDDLFNKMRWMIKGADCEVLILDPLQAAVPSNENGVIDKWMDSCLKLCKETGVSLIVVSHMNKPASTDPHAVSEYHTKGSGSINQIAFNTILLSRDKMAESEYERNLTKVQLVKCRRTGRTGDCGWMYYNGETTRMEQGEAPELHEANTIEEF